MSLNSSSFSNSSLPPSPLSSFTSLTIFLHNCFNSTVGVLTITTFSITNILTLLPLCILVLYLGHQRWRQQRPGTTMSHSDFFTYNMVISELMSVSASTLTCIGVHTDLPQMITVGIYLLSMNLSAQMLFHILTCVERYMAVVHPITYLSLRTANGIRLRNITIGCVWLLCFTGAGAISIIDKVLMIMMSICMTAFTLTIISFCSLSVLCVLIRPGPGEGGGGRRKVDQSKLRAFYTIMVILGMLFIRFGGALLTTALSTTGQLEETGKCDIWLSYFWFNLPSSLVLPLLFLQRAGKLLCCKNNKESGQGAD